MSFIRVKRRGDRQYAYLVETSWEAGAPRQRVLKYLGRAEGVDASLVPAEHREQPAVVAWLARRKPPADAQRARAQLLDALLAADAPRVQRLAEAGAARMGTRSYQDDVLAPLLRQVGDEWHAGRLDVAQEHMVTRGVQDVVRRFREDAARAAARRRGERATVFLCNPEGEPHALALDMLEARLAMGGHRAFVAPGGAPARDLARQARALAPDLVVVSATLPEARGGALRLASDLVAAAPGALVALGGQAFAGAPPRDLHPRVRVVTQTSSEALDALVADALGAA